MTSTTTKLTTEPTASDDDWSLELGNVTGAKIGDLVIRRTNGRPLDMGLFQTFYGQGGSGKTTVAASAADSEFGSPYLHIDAEGGIDAISHRSDIDFVQVFTWRQYRRLISELKRNPNHGFKTICADNLSEIVNMATAHVTGDPEKQPTQPEWGEMARLILRMVRDCREMAQKQNINFFFTAWDTDDKDDSGARKKQIAFTPKLQSEFPGVVTTIGHVTVLNDATKRLLDWRTNPRTISKWRKSLSSAAQKIPLQLYYGTDRLPMGDILDALIGGKEIDWTRRYPTPSQNSK